MDLEKKFDRVLFYLEDDPSTGQKGLVHKLEDIAQRLERMEEREKVARAKVSAYGAIGGAIILAGWKLITFLWPK